MLHVEHSLDSHKHSEESNIEGYILTHDTRWSKRQRVNLTYLPEIKNAESEDTR